MIMKWSCLTLHEPWFLGVVRDLLIKPRERNLSKDYVFCSFVDSEFMVDGQGIFNELEGRLFCNVTFCVVCFAS